MMDPSILNDASILDFGLFIAGCIAGYTWANRTIVKMSNDRTAELRGDLEKQKTEFDAKLTNEKAECDAKIEKLEKRIQDLEDQRFDLARGG